MNYVIQAALSNTQHPECGQVTISFPIPVDQYNKTIEMLQAIDLDFSVNRDCKVDELNSRYRVLKQVYNKRQFALYPYDGILMVLEIMPKQGLAEGESPDHLSGSDLPALNRMSWAVWRAANPAGRRAIQ